jgi:hypothetical protein
MLEFRGLEPDSSYVDFANRRATTPNERTTWGRAEDIPASLGSSFAVILSNDVLHHVQSQKLAFAGVASVATHRAVWLAIELNVLNPYSFVRQQFGFGERNFFPGAAARVAAEVGWRLTARGNLFLIPPFVRAPQEWMLSLERHLELSPVLAGGLWLRFRRRG